MTRNVMRKPLIGAVLLLTSLGITTSCLDKDIDRTIDEGGEFPAIPLGSTEKITMDKIIELNDGDDVQVVNGEYYLLKTGELNDAATDVKSAVVKGYDNKIDRISVVNERTLPDIEGIITTEINEKGSIKADVRDIDEAVKEIGILEAEYDADLYLNLNLALTGDLSYESITAELIVTFPDFLQFKKDENLTGNVLKLDLLNNDLQPGIPYKYHLKLTGYKFGTKAGEGRLVENNELKINDKVTITGTAHVKVYGAIKVGNNLEILPTVMQRDMTIKSVTGIIQPTIEETGSTVELSNLSDFLQDDDVELGIINPLFTFIAKNPLDAPIELNGEMFGAKEGKKIENSTVVIGEKSADKAPIVLEPNTTTIIALSRLGSGGPEGSKNIKVSDINNLIKKIPDVIDVKLQPAITYDKYYTMLLERTCLMASSYDIQIPLSCGNLLKIAYKNSIDDLHSDLKDVDFKKAVISATVDNVIPRQLEIKENNVTPKDINGNTINDIKVTVAGTIADSKDGNTVATSQLTITLEETKDGAIRNLDDLVFEVTAVPGQAANVPLRNDQWLQLKDMKLSIPDGIRVNLN